MDEKLKRSIISKAFKIACYERQPQTDRQFLKNKADLEEQYGIAKRYYLLTSDEKYKCEMKRIKQRQKLNISKSEYESYVQAIRALKEEYCDSRYDGFWAMISAYLKRHDIKHRGGEKFFAAAVFAYLFLLFIISL